MNDSPTTLDAAVQGILRGNNTLDKIYPASARAAQAVVLIEKHLGIRESLPVPTEWAHKVPAVRQFGKIVLPEPEWEPEPTRPRWWRRGKARPR